MENETIKGAWDRIDLWLANHSPAALLSLERPASWQDIASLEQSVGRKLPADLTAALAIHNGQQPARRPGIFPYTGFMGAEEYSLFCASEITSNRQMMNDLLDGGDFAGLVAKADPGVCESWWNALWIPIAWNGGGDYFCVDLDPADGGSVGQLIHFAHDGNKRRLIAPSMTAYLAALADDLESGRVVVSPNGSLIYPSRKRNWGP